MLIIKIIKGNKYEMFLNKVSIIKPIYDSIGTLHKNMIAVKKDNKWGFVKFNVFNNPPLKEVIEPIYDEVEHYKRTIHKSKALVTLNGEQFYINRKGEKI